MNIKYFAVLFFLSASINYGAATSSLLGNPSAASDESEVNTFIEDYLIKEFEGFGGAGYIERIQQVLARLSAKDFRSLIDGLQASYR